jgi:Tfp pilus assembly protein PilF
MSERRDKLTKMLESTPDDPFVHYALAMEDVSEGDEVGAADRLGQLIERNPDYVAAYLQMGQVLARLGDTDAAKGVLKAGIKVAKKAGDAHAASEMDGLLKSL